MMRRTLPLISKTALLYLQLAQPLGARAAATINTTNAYGYGANVDWIHMGDGTPAETTPGTAAVSGNSATAATVSTNPWANFAF